jgi:hypothetical protein
MNLYTCGGQLNGIEQRRQAFPDIQDGFAENMTISHEEGIE